MTNILQFFDFFTTLPFDLITVFVLLIAMIVLFMRGRLRYDLIALATLLVIVVAGVIPADAAFAGFSHPAVVIVVAMFVLSQALVNSGIVEAVTRRFSVLAGRPILQLLALTTFVGISSAFLANVGALAFSIPIAMKMAEDSDVSPGMFLLPVAFASHLGAFVTLIGSPRNVIVSSFREDAVGAGFGFFDFATIGIGIIVVGILFLTFLAWRFIPRRSGEESASDLFTVENYITEVSVPESASIVGESIGDLLDQTDADFVVVSMARGERVISYPSRRHKLASGDRLFLQDDAESLTDFVEANGLRLVGDRAREGWIENDDQTVDTEAVVTRDSLLLQKKWKQIPLNMRYGVNLLAVSRSGGQLDEHLDNLQFRAGDVLLLRGREDSVNYTLKALNCLPLENRDLKLGRTRQILSTLALFVLAVIVASFGLLPVHIAFLSAAVAAVFFGLVGVKEAYENIDWSVVVLLGAIITFGEAVVSVGGADEIASAILSLTDYLSPVMMLVAVMLATTLLSDFVNANVAAVIMAPVGILIAETIGVSIDPLLLAVAVGANMAFLTPTAHESNTLVMGPGGYKYRDFWKVGLPLELLIIGVSIPLILFFWPLEPSTENIDTDLQPNIQQEAVETVSVIDNQ